MDGLNSLHPRLPVPPERVDDAVVAFQEQLMAMEFQRLDIEEEMRLGMARSSGTRLHVLCEDEIEGATPCAEIDECISTCKAAGEARTENLVQKTLFV
eukprot:COSAG02_NODE_960_length_15642_cov_34.870424_5_plen_98_part_00